MSEANPGFDIVGDLLALSRTEEPSSLLNTTTRVVTTRVTTRGVERRTTTRGVEFLRSLPLSSAETLARAAAAGRFPRFKSPEFYVWKIRLAVERGLVRPHRVLTLALSGADPPTVKVWEGFLLLVGCKWLYEPAVPTVFSREFAAPWCGVTVEQARVAITALKGTGHMRPVGRCGRATLWLPGGRG